MGSEVALSLSSSEHQDLHRIVGIMIPANPEYCVPAGNDSIIFSDILTSLGRDRADVAAAMAELNAFAGGAFTTLDDNRATAIADAFLASGTRAVAALGRVVLQSYYRDDRVLLALGHEPRAPFPKGYTLEQGDWSLLDVVRERQPFWRHAREQ